MKKENFILLFFLISLLVQSQSLTNVQEITRSHRRYWYYRTRFINDFTKIGDKQGDCIVFAQRNFEYSENGDTPVNFTKYHSKVGPDQIDIMNQYLSALALEYKILTRTNQSTTETIKEIFYIIKTINRLDDEADYFWSVPSNYQFTHDHLPNFNGSNLNGFMLREDMPIDYFDTSTIKTTAYANTPYADVCNENNRHFNYSETEYNWTGADNEASFAGLHKINYLSTDNKFSNYKQFPNQTGRQKIEQLPMVHDKYYSMFVAFLFIRKYIPSGTVYTENGIVQSFQDGETDINEEVKKIANRCHPFLRGNIFGGSASDWQMNFPDGISYSANGIGLGQPLPYSYPLTRTICHLNNNFPWVNFGCIAYSDIVAQSMGSVYSSLSLSPVLTNDIAVFLANNHIGSNESANLLPISLFMSYNSSLNNIKWANLMRKVLHENGQLNASIPEFANPINNAPCKGPWNFGPSDQAPDGWRASDRLEHTDNMTSGGPPGNYPGVDYMLLHNLLYEYLFQLNDNNKLPNAYIFAGNLASTNLMDNYDEQIWPFQYSTTSGGNFNNQLTINATYGVDTTVNQTSNPPGPGTLWTIKQPGYAKVFQHLTSRAQIYSVTSPAAPTNTLKTKVEYRAGKDITLLPEGNGQPGFEVKAGADFHAFVKRYVCTDGDYGNGMRQGQSNNEQVNNNYETDAMMDFIPLHFVEYPKVSNYSSSEIDYEDYYNSTKDVEQTLLKNQFLKENGMQTTNSIINRTEISPNPNNGSFKVTVNTFEDNEYFNVEVLDMKGQIILFFKLNDNDLSKEINLQNYAKGVYLVKIFSSLGNNYIKKVVVE